MDYIGHQVSLAGLEAHPKDLGSLVNIPFPRTLRSMQSFLGSLNYYSRFIEDFAIYASVLYELREADFHEIRRMDKIVLSTPKDVTGGDPDLSCVTGGDPETNDQEVKVIAIQIVPLLQGATQILRTEVDGRRR